MITVTGMSEFEGLRHEQPQPNWLGMDCSRMISATCPLFAEQPPVIAMAVKGQEAEWSCCELFAGIVNGLVTSTMRAARGASEAGQLQDVASPASTRRV